MASTENKVIISALYDDDDILLKGLKSVKAQGYHIEEVYSPFPIHGLDPAMGLKPTRMAITAFIYGVLGLATSIALSYGMMIVDWPMNIGGKPSFTWGENMPAFVPIMFELTVFFAAHLMVWTYFFRNGLFPGRSAQNPDPRTTDDKFLMEVELGRKGSKEELLSLLKDSGAIEINENSK